MSSPVTPNTYGQSGRRSYLPRTRRGWLACIGVMLLLAATCVFLLARMTPSWYAPLDPNSNRVIDNFDSGQNKIRFELHNAMERVPLGDQNWTITQDEINSVLAVSFAGSATQANSPALISAPVVVFTPGKITLAARSSKLPGSDPAGGVGSVVFVVAMLPAASTPASMPMGLVKVDSVWVGNLPVPKSLAQSRIRAMGPALVAASNQFLAYQLGVRDSANVIPQIEDAIQSITRGEPFPLSRTYDRRVVVIKKIQVDRGSLTITFGPPPPASPVPVVPRPVAPPAAR